MNQYVNTRNDAEFIRPVLKRELEVLVGSGRSFDNFAIGEGDLIYVEVCRIPNHLLS
jgi:hypothetical protein